MRSGLLQKAIRSGDMAVGLISVSGIAILGFTGSEISIDIFLSAACIRFIEELKV